MAVDVLLAQRRKGLVVHDDDVGGSAGLKHTELTIEVLAGHLGVVLEQHGHSLAPAHVGHGGDHVVVVIATLLGGPLGKFGVFGNGLVAFFLAAAIGDLVAQARTHAQLLSCILNGKEATRNLAEARMVIENRGDAIADGIQDRGIGAGLGAVERQVVVDLPPLLLKILQEVGGVAALDGKAAGQTRVDVGVAVDESGHDEVALGVDVLGIRVLGLELALGAHFDDCISVNGDRTVWNERSLSVAG